MALPIPAGADPCTIPLAINPNGSPMNLENPESLGTTLVGSISTFIVLTSVCVLIRIMNNYRQLPKLYMDDYFCVLGWVFNTARGILFVLQTSTAYHAWDIPICRFDERWFKVNASYSLINPPCLWLIKTSIFTLYLRIFGNLRWVRFACWFGILFFGLAYLSIVPVYIIYVFPYGDETWSLPLAFKAAKAGPANVAIACFTMVADLYLIILPLPVVANLQASLKRKLGLCGVFLAGLAALATAAVNVRFRVVAARTVATVNTDSTWNVSLQMISDFAETSTGLIICCVPALVSCWKSVFQGPTFMPTLRSLLRSTLDFTKRSTSFSHSSKSDADLPFRSDHGASSYELHLASGPSSFSAAYADKNRASNQENVNGITRLVEVVTTENRDTRRTQWGPLETGSS